MGHLKGKSKAYELVYGSLVFVLIVAYLVSATIFSILLPAFGWDTLSTWAPQAITILDGASDSANELQPLRHPPLNKYIVGFLAQLAKIIGAPSFLFAAIFFWLASCICCFLAKTPRPVWMASMLCAILLSVPLFENHVAIAGYAEIWISIFLLAACISVSRYITSNRLIDLCLVLFTSVPIIFMKNFGGLVFLSVWVAMFSLIYMRYRFAVIRLWFAILCSFGLILCLVGFELSSPAARQIWDDSINNWIMEAAYIKWEPEKLRLILYDRVFYIGTQGTFQSFKLWIHLIFQNQSFATLAVFTFLLLSLNRRKVDSLFVENFRLVVGITSSVVICSLFAVQAFTNLGGDAVVGSDTIISRLLLVIIPAICFYAVLVFTSPNLSQR